MDDATKTPLSRNARLWEAHEESVLSVLFDRKENPQSPIEAFLEAKLETELRITDYVLGFARFGEYWLATVSIICNQIEAAPGKTVSGRRSGMCSMTSPTYCPGSLPRGGPLQVFPSPGARLHSGAAT